MIFPLKNPTPDFETLESVITGRQLPARMHFVEEFADVEVIRYITTHFLTERFPQLDETFPSMGSNSHLEKKFRQFLKDGTFRFIDGEPDIIRIRRDIEFYYRMGFDYLADLHPFAINFDLMTARMRSQDPDRRDFLSAGDTAKGELSRGTRQWQDEGRGIIRSWDDFEKVDWDIDLNQYGFEQYYTTIKANLPEGMKVPIVGTLFDPGTVGGFMGFEDFCIYLYEQPDLVKATVDKFGQATYNLYERALESDVVGFVWHADDFAFNSSTMISKEKLKELFFPWFRKYARLARDHGKMFWLHACGNMYELMPELINDVGIDAKQSFEDKIFPVTEFKKVYGDRVAPLGGIDVDKLCRMDEEDLRAHCRSVLDVCMEGGRYAFGTGNTVANYIPIPNYLAMMEEGYNYLR